jgi:bifunctional non-homologous end joining protein LigD
MTQWSDDPASVRPMLATTADAPLDSPALVYEPKYDGIRALASVPGGSKPARLWSRLGNEKSTQFPEVVAALHRAAAVFGRPVLLDGEIVALDERGEPVGFQGLQGRIHLKTPARGSPAPATRVAFIVFDLLRDGQEDLRGGPLHERRARLERLFARVEDPLLRVSEQASGDGHAMFERAQRHGWEGLIAKSASSTYTSGRRSPEWRKLKLVRRQACVIGGWTEPRGSRPFFGALLLGLHDDDGRLHYVAHTGAGFTDAELGRVWKKLQALKTRACPFATVPRTNERPHWVKPTLVAEVKFTEWTADNKLRHPTYLGLREDMKAEAVRKEPDQIVGETPRREMARTRARAATRAGGQTARAAAESDPARVLSKTAVAQLLEQLDTIQARGGDGVLELPGGGRLDVSNLGKVFWPKLKLTKGDLLRHYVRVARVILPALADRPLVMKRYPNGIAAKPFYQHRAPEKPPPGVRVESVSTDSERRAHVVGGNLLSLLYTSQLASISQDPWFSRVGSVRMADHVAIDLDPPDGLSFTRVLDVARWVRDELAALKTPGFAKTSGSSGLHIYIPMPPGTPYEAGLLFCQIVATIVANKHPKWATVERSVAARGSRVYVDYLQNILGKTLASAYSPRANEFAGVSTPLTWTEIDEGVSPKDFTIPTFEARLAAVGDLWEGLRQSKGADLAAVARYAKATKTRRT